MREGVTTDERDRIKTLEREVQLNDIGPLSEDRLQRGIGHRAEDRGTQSSNRGPKAADSSQPVVEQVHRPMFLGTRTVDL